MIELTVLGSGSRGNATFVRLGDRGVLVDCGLSLRMTRTRLAERGIDPASITDLLVTHFDRDHFYPGWAKEAGKEGLRVHLHERHRTRAVSLGLGGGAMHLFRDDSFEIGPAWVEPVLLAHDSLGSVGYVIEHEGCRLGWATDLGRVPKNLLAAFVRLHALGLESNYHPPMQLRSGRPPMLIERIMSGRGHLSNDQARDAVRTIAQSSGLELVVALHLSEQCNDPDVVRAGYADDLPKLADVLTIARQREATPVLSVTGHRPLPQPELFSTTPAALRTT